MSTKKQREQAEVLENLRDALTAAGPEGGATLLIINASSKSSSTGRNHYLEIKLLENKHAENFASQGDGFRFRPRATLDLTYNVAKLLGYRLTKDGQIIMGGYGYSRSQQLTDHLAHKAGHPLYVQTIGEGMGDTNGWIGKVKVAS
jgi:hypothetical protein